MQLQMEPVEAIQNKEQSHIGRMNESSLKGVARVLADPAEELLSEWT